MPSLAQHSSNDAETVVSIVIPAYNAEKTIAKCIESCIQQDYKNLDIIVINDGSTDNTKDLVENYTKKNSNIRNFNISNRGQGHARNLGIFEAYGSYIFFLDADDTIQEITISLLFQAVAKSNADIAFCDWCYIDPKGQRYGYSNFIEKIPPGSISKEAKPLLAQKTYFSVNKLYRKQFLLEEKIEFGEGYIYEDNEFYIGSLIRAKDIIYVPYPLYNVHINSTSSTKINYKSNYHGQSFEKAVNSTLEKYSHEIEQTELAPYYVKYIIHRIGLYTAVQRRVPFANWHFFITNILKKTSALKLSHNDISKLPKQYRLILKTNRISAFLSMLTLLFIFYINRSSAAKKINSYFRKLVKKTKNKINSVRIKIRSSTGKKELIDSNLIFFHAFDEQIKGNTRALLHKFIDTDYRLAICAPKMDELKSNNITYLEKGSKKYYYYANRAKFHILETWGDLSIKKRPESCWIQLWHGTPIKKLLFDSQELFISNKNRRHKRNKLWDIFRWDYVLSQNAFCTAKLRTAFSLDRHKILELGYPRTDFLHSKNSDLNAITIRIKEKYNIKNKIIIYAPTWRDYNKYSFIQSFNYLLTSCSAQTLAQYSIIYLGHPFDVQANVSGHLINSSDDDLDDLIRAGDFLITDYSSILFDWLETEKPFALLWKDLQLYDYDRGIYDEIISDFSEFIAFNEEKLIQLINNNPTYSSIKNIDKYISANCDSADNLFKHISEI